MHLLSVTQRFIKMNQQKYEELKKKAEEVIAKQFVPEENTLEYFLRKQPELFKNKRNFKER